MSFTTYSYVKPDINKLKQQAAELAKAFQLAKDFKTLWPIFQQITKFQMRIDTMNELANIRNSLNVFDTFYSEAVDLVSEIAPSIEEFNQKFYELFLSSPFRPELEKKLGSYFFHVLGLAKKTFAPAIMTDLVEEKKLVKKYQELLASAKIPFEGKVFSLSQLTPYTQSADRAMRKKASEASFGFFAEHLDELDSIYDKLVKVRTKIAQKLGYKNFVQLGYDRMNRLDYGPAEVKTYRDQIYQDVVPLASKLIERQSKRIKISDMQYYDLGFKFLTGNPTPKGEAQWLVDQAAQMYRELSPETDAFFQLLQKENLMDLESRSGKMTGGYCNYLYEPQWPFIFANFNGTQHDVEVLTHEFGHAFQAYQSKDYLVREYMVPTMESAEIHSMSMEFFTYPWMKNFFKEDVDKFTYSHLTGALLFLPYGVTVDEFQHWVYENPTVTPLERRKKWREIEKKYTPYKNYGDNAFLENGGFWMRQAHIYASPFYYIDYTIAQVIALQFYVRMKKDYRSAWKTYVDLCRLGGSLPFTQLLQKTGLDSPFKEGYIRSLIPTLQKELEAIPDLKL